MKFGSLPPPPEDGDLSKWCLHDALEIGDQWIIVGFIGSCPRCVDGQMKDVPNEFLVQYLGNTEDGTYHVFQAIEVVRCGGCHSIMDKFSILCQSKVTGINVTEEFVEINK